MLDELQVSNCCKVGFVKGGRRCLWFCLALFMDMKTKMVKRVSRGM